MNSRMSDDSFHAIKPVLGIFRVCIKVLHYVLVAITQLCLNQSNTVQILNNTEMEAFDWVSHFRLTGIHQSRVSCPNHCAMPSHFWLRTYILLFAPIY